MTAFTAFKDVKIVYFTGTGGTKRIAQAFERTLKDRGLAVDCLELRQPSNFGAAKNPPQLPPKKWGPQEGDLLVVLFPVYAFNAPKPIDEWLESLPQREGVSAGSPSNNRAVVLSVSGGGEIMPNTACRLGTIKALENKGYHVIYEDMFVMPSNIFMAYSDDISSLLLKAIPHKVEKIVTSIFAGTLRRTRPLVLDRLNSAFGLIEKRYFGRAFGKRLSANSSCTSCGRCVHACPRANIAMNSDAKVPTFGEKCVICLACIYACPQGAIVPGVGKNAVLKGGYSLEALEKRVSSHQPSDGLGPSVLPKGYLMSGVRKYLEEVMPLGEENGHQKSGD